MKKIVDYIMIVAVSMLTMSLNLMSVIFSYETTMRILTMGVTDNIGEMLVTSFWWLLVLCLDSVVAYAFFKQIGGMQNEI